MPELRIGGLTRLSSCDWPGELVATVFCQGCSWRCPYCHNPELQPAAGPDAVAWQDVLAFLETRVGLLDGVVFSGGEPLLQDALGKALRDVRSIGLKTALHTGGAVPFRFVEFLRHVDWVGFDVKAPFDDYARITGSSKSGSDAQECLLHLIANGGEFEVRTTVHPRLFDGEVLFRMAEQLTGLGIGRWILQHYRTYSSATLAAEPYGKNVLARLQACGLQIVWR